MSLRPVTIEDGRVVTHEPSPLIEHYTPDSILRHFREFQARGCRDQTFHDNGPHMVESLLARLATVEAERAALAADADRLSWLQHIAQVSRYGVAIAPVGATRLALWEPLDGEIPDGWCLARSAFSLRDAIDEGRAQEDARRPPTPGDTP